MTPKQNALAFRIWRHAEPLGWDCTASEIADALRVTPQAVGLVCKAKGWQTRIRKTSAHPLNFVGDFAADDVLGGASAAAITERLRASADEALA